MEGRVRLSPNVFTNVVVSIFLSFSWAFSIAEEGVRVHGAGNNGVIITERKMLQDGALEQSKFIFASGKKRGVDLRFARPSEWRAEMSVCGDHLAGALETIESLARRYNALVGINMSYYGHAFNSTPTGDLLGQLVSDSQLINSINPVISDRVGVFGYDADSRFIMAEHIVPEIMLTLPEIGVVTNVAINSLEWGSSTKAVVWNSKVGSWPMAPKYADIVWAQSINRSKDNGFRLGSELHYTITDIGPVRAFKEGEIAIFLPAAKALPEKGDIILQIDYPEPWNSCSEIGECGPIVYSNGVDVLPVSWQSKETIIALGENRGRDWIVLAAEDCNRDELLAIGRYFDVLNLTLLDGGTSASIVVDGFQMFGCWKDVGSGVLFYRKDSEAGQGQP